jgi:uncharacterized protein YoxC
MIVYILLWLVALALVVLALAVRANERDIAELRREIAEKQEDDLK